MGYMDQLQTIAEEDIETLKEKDKEYAGSWKKRGGAGAYLMAARKFDRLDEQLEKFRNQWDVFTAAEEDTRPEGILDDIGDLRRYLMLIEAELMDRRIQAALDSPPTKYEGIPK